MRPSRVHQLLVNTVLASVSWSKYSLGLSIPLLVSACDGQRYRLTQFGFGLSHPLSHNEFTQVNTFKLQGKT